MNSKEFHQATILGLIQTTINRTFLDLERRQLFEVTTREQLINWTELRSLTNEINWLFDREINSHRERISIENLITEIHLRAPSIYIVLVNSNAFDQALSNGIRSYSRHIKRNNITVAPGVRGVFEQTLNEQINYGILEIHNRHFQISTHTSRYLEYRHTIRRFINEFFQSQGANNTHNRQFVIAQQDISWCLFNYKDLPFYRTVLRDYIETVYQEARRELQRQQLDIPITQFINKLETYINEQCTYLHFNLRFDAARFIVNRRYWQLQRQQQQPLAMALDQAGLQNVLNAVFGQNGLNVPQLIQNVNAAPPPRELSIVKVDSFSGRDDEDPYAWIDQFEQAAITNQWADGRLVDFAIGHLRGAAADWIRGATAVNANNRITTWDTNGAAATSFKPRFFEKFAPETKQNRWYHELMTTRQHANESVDDYSLRFQRLLRKVNILPNAPAVPAGLQVRMYLFGLSPLLTPLVSTNNPADLNAAIERARLVENGYHYTPQNTVQKDMEVDDLTKRIEQLTLNYANLASALAVQPIQNNRDQ